jgi:hypothetical protein
VVLVALLDEKSDTAVLAGDDTDSLFQGVSIMQKEPVMSSCPGIGALLLRIWRVGIESYLVGDLALVLRQVSRMLSKIGDSVYLAAVDAPQVEGIAREGDAVRPLHHRGAVALCPQSVAIPQLSRLPAPSLTGDLPRKVSGNSGGHFM